MTTASSNVDPKQPALRQVERAPIPRHRVLRLVQELLEVQDLTDVASLALHARAVEAEVYARDAQGRRFLVGDEVAVDRIHIPIADDEPTP
jgi:hypothetical protein